MTRATGKILVDHSLTEVMVRVKDLAGIVEVADFHGSLKVSPEEVAAAFSHELVRLIQEALDAQREEIIHAVTQVQKSRRYEAFV